MELKEGMYVRYKQFKFDKVVKIGKLTSVQFKEVDNYGSNYIILKASYNIIDLIEVGDYVNGEYVTNIVSNHSYIGISREFIMIKEEDIKSIVTKEQFESMSYKVGE